MTTTDHTPTLSDFDELTDAARKIMQDALTHSRDDYDRETAYEAVAEAGIKLTPRDLDYLPAMTQATRDAYAAVQAADESQLCRVLARLTPALQAAEDRILALKEYELPGEWLSLVFVRKATEDIGHSTVDLVLRNMVSFGYLELAPYAGDVSDRLDEAGVDIHGDRAHKLRFLS